MMDSVCTFNIQQEQIYNEKQINLEISEKYEPCLSLEIKTTINIQKKHLIEEDLIIEAFKFERNLGLQEKIFITEEIIKKSSTFINNQDFYEEECFYSLINWGVECSNIINYSYMEKNNILDQRYFILLNNILIIFESFPINHNDLISLKFVQKFNKIKKNIKKLNLNIFFRIENLILYWNSFIENNSIILLSNKRSRENLYNLTNENTEKKKNNFYKNEKIIEISPNLFTQVNYPKSILKKNINNRNIEKKNISWESEDKLNHIKIFKYYDTPDSPEVSKEEYEKIQEALFIEKYTDFLNVFNQDKQNSVNKLQEMLENVKEERDENKEGKN